MKPDDERLNFPHLRVGIWREVPLDAQKLFPLKGQQANIRPKKTNGILVIGLKNDSEPFVAHITNLPADFLQTKGFALAGKHKSKKEKIKKELKAKVKVLTFDLDAILDSF